MGTGLGLGLRNHLRLHLRLRNRLGLTLRLTLRGHDTHRTGTNVTGRADDHPLGDRHQRLTYERQGVVTPLRTLLGRTQETLGDTPSVTAVVPFPPNLSDFKN